MFSRFYFNDPATTEIYTLSLQQALPISIQATLTATDNCDANPTVTPSESRTDGNCPSNYKLLRTWASEESWYKSSEKSHTVTVIDTAETELSDSSADVMVQCNAVPNQAT